MDATFSVVVARHGALESFHLGPNYYDKITSDFVAFSNTKMLLRKFTNMVKGLDVFVKDANLASSSIAHKCFLFSFNLPCIACRRATCNDQLSFLLV
ncbi:hypothetical protein SUGI_0789380 [Cryptomeria japonica]|nr:hypothetical protein SUGI_0789380 [Cryptomeria japonica]